MKYLLCLFLLLSCLGCQNSPTKLEHWIEPNKKVKVLSTTAIIDDLVGQVGGEKIDHIALIAGAMDPHSYELVKGDDEKLSYAHVVFYNGLGLEHGGSLRYRLEQHPKAVSIGDHLHKKRPEAVLSDRGQVDPHIWLDISIWAEAVDPIVEALAQADPDNSAYFQENGKNVKESLLALDASIQEKMARIEPEKRYLVTSHDAFNYFTRRYLREDNGAWKERFCAPEGLAPDGQLSCHDIQLVIDHLSRHRIHVMFPETNISRDSLKKIASVCREKGIAVEISKEALFSDTLGAPGSASDTYQKMMEHNVQVLCEAWQ
jgi:manganese/zinc/iron transport system substrate-binding protein